MPSPRFLPALAWAATAAYAGAAGVPAAVPPTYTELAALVARAEGGDEAALADGLAATAAFPEGPLAGAARGRLVILQGQAGSFVASRYWRFYRGFTELNRYIASHGEDPLPRVWRAAAAVETSYVFWSQANTRADLSRAAELYAADPDLPDETPRCKLLLGTCAKDAGDLRAALAYWREAYAADPTDAAGREAARLLALFTG